MDTAEAEHLVRLETALARREPGPAGAALADLLDADFVEHGSSGRRWTRADIVRELDGAPNELQLEDVAVTALGERAALVTYRSRDPAGRAADAWRVSVWVRGDDGWRMRFHQGTPLRGGSGIG
jgi:ribonuclease HI